MKANFKYLYWRARKIRLRLIREVGRRLYRDTDRDTAKSILLAGSGRSGTTWLAQIIRSQTRCRIMFEPFYPEAIEAYRDFNYYQYVRPTAENPALLTYCRRLFSGDIRNPWIDRQVDLLRPESRLIKAVRASFLLGWIRRNFPEVPIVFVVRHPCAVVASRMGLDWATDEDIEPFLQQAELVGDFMGEMVEYVRALRTDEEKHAVIWSLHNLVALRHLAAGEGLIVFYENLCVQPEVEVPRIFREIRQPYRESVFETLSKPSTTSTRASAAVSGGDVLGRWRSSLSRQQVRRILAVVERFGLEGLYGDSLTPLTASDSYLPDGGRR